MLGLRKIVLGISDLKKILISIRTKYADDFTNYAVSSLKRRVEEFMNRYHLVSVDELILKLEKDDKFYQIFLKSILVDTTEMFRDPEFWDELKNLVLKKYRYAEEIKIWIPDCNSGEELYSLKIIINILKFEEKTKVLLTTMNELNIERIQKAALDQKSMELNTANFERFEEGKKLDEYFTSKANIAILDPDILENVSFEVHNLFLNPSPGVFDIILFRNKTLYFNPQLKIDALKILTSSLKPGGYITMGIKETLDYPSWENDYVLISESERIYKKVQQ